MKRTLAVASAAFAAASQSAMSCDSTRRVPFILLGAGGVGSALLEAIQRNRELHASRFHVEFVPLAVVDSSAAVSGKTVSEGLADADVSALIEHESAGKRLSNASAGTVVGRTEGQDAAEFFLSVVNRYSAHEPDTMCAHWSIFCIARHLRKPRLASIVITPLPHPLHPHVPCATPRTQCG